MKSMEQFFINTMLGYQPDEMLWEENNYDGFPLGHSSLRYFKFDLDGDIVRIRASVLVLRATCAKATSRLSLCFICYLLS